MEVKPALDGEQANLNVKQTGFWKVIKILLVTYKIIESLKLERDLKYHLVPTPCYGQGHPPLDLAA